MWLIAPTSGAGTAIAADGTTRNWVLTIPAADGGATTGWTYLAGGAAPDVSRADLLKLLTVAVESLQGTFEADDNPWTRDDTAVVPANPDGS